MSEKRKRVLQVNIDNNGGNGAFTLARQQEADIQCWDLMQAERR